MVMTIKIRKFKRVDCNKKPPDLEFGSGLTSNSLAHAPQKVTQNNILLHRVSLKGRELIGRFATVNLFQNKC